MPEEEVAFPRGQVVLSISKLYHIIRLTSCNERVEFEKNGSIVFPENGQVGGGCDVGY